MASDPEKELVPGAGMETYGRNSLTDRDIMGDKTDVTHEEAMHWGELTEEEKVIAKKLKTRIDSVIMPLVILVYLMNYIDR